MQENTKLLEKWIDGHDKVKLFSYSNPVKSVQQAIKVSGYPEKAIIKTIIMHHRFEKETVAVIIAAESRVDKEKLQDKVDPSQWEMASPDKVLEVTGFPVGGVPPVCLGNSITRYVDPKVLKQDFVIGGGGSTTSLLGLPPDLIVEDGAKVKSVSKV